MRLNTFVLLSCIIANSCFAQSNSGPVDSLKKALQANNIEDSNRVLLLVKLTSAVYTSTPDEAMKYADEALKISEKIKWQKGLALSYKCRGGVNIVLTNFTLALDDYQKALDYDLEESKIFEATILNNIGIIYDELKQHDKALINYKKCLAVSIELKNRETETMALGNIGTIYQQYKNYDSALYYYTTALARVREIDNKRLECNILCTLASLYKETGKYQQAIEYAEKSIEMADLSGNLYVKAPALNNLAWAHLLLLHYDKSEEYYRQSLEVSKKMNNIQWQSESWDGLYAIYKGQNKLDRALEAYKAYILLRDSAVNDEKKQEITRKEIQYTADKKEAVLKTENEAKLTEQRITRNAIIAGAAVLLLGVVISFFFYKRKRDAVTRQKEAEFKTEITDTELKVMRLQMNPHFIFNSLNSISDYIAKNNPKEADDYLSKFAKVMRMTLENSEQQAIPLNDDLKALDLYMQLEAKRLDNKFTYEIKVGDDIDKENTLVPPMIFQPFVENSIWHGIAKKEGKGHIIIDIRKEGEMLNCRIDDDGIGRTQAESLKVQQEEKKQSMGMRITKARIEILNKLKGSNATVQLIDKIQGVTAELKLPVETNF